MRLFGSDPSRGGHAGTTGDRLIIDNDRLMAFLFLAIACCLTYLFIHLEALRFVTGHQLEYADFANNALRINDAKAGKELYGNYSRWEFYHPGPAFWYLYAAGEYVFYDWTGIISSPHFAHIMTGTLFQVGCTVAALLLLARKVGWIFLPCALSILLWHWHFMLGAPTSIWPPHVLFGPFLLLITFGAAVASGEDRWLPVVVFAGGMLIHGHVAQPLFVVPIGCTVLFLCIGRKRSEGSPWNGWAILWAVAIMLLFGLPLLVDCFKGGDSNLSAIFRHIHASSGSHHTIQQGLGYVLSFLWYSMNQSVDIGSADFSLLKMLSGHGFFVLLSMACIAAGLYLSYKGAHFERCFSLLLGISLLLAVIWGAVQDGGMFDFNGNFIYAIIYLLYLLPVIVLVKFVQSRPIVQQALFVALGVALLGWSAYKSPKPIFTMATEAGDFRSSLGQLVSGATVVQVKIAPGHWLSAYAAILELDRMGVPFQVEDGYKFLLGQRRQGGIDESRPVVIEVSGDPCEGGLPIPFAGTPPASVVCKRMPASSSNVTAP